MLARFRVPAIPFFAIGAALFVTDVFRMGQLAGLAFFPRTKNPLWIPLKYVLAWLAGVYFVWGIYPSYRKAYESGLTKLTRPAGVHLETSSTLMVHDNGPNYLDGWMAANLNSDVTFSKTFSAHGMDLSKYAKAYVTVTLYTLESRAIEVVCNGKRETVNLIPHDLYRLPLIPVRLGPFPVPEDLTFTFSFPGLAPDQVGLAVDFHRDYGRTTYLGEAFPAEAVVRLELEKKDQHPESAAP